MIMRTVGGPPRSFIFRNSLHPKSSIVISIAHRRHYASEPPPPKLHPLSKPTPDDMDPRYSDIPDWTVPPINQQDLTETPVEPYYDKQTRRYYGEPVSIHFPFQSDICRFLNKMKSCQCLLPMHLVNTHFLTH